MKKLAILMLLTVLSFNSYSQIKFEKGYFINNNDEKTECLIKNVDWGKNPTKFEYQLKKNSNSKTLSIENVEEFGIYDFSTYKRFDVKFDSSTDVTSRLNYQRKPQFGKDETVFLKELIKGKATLYYYVGAGGNLRRFFYKLEGSVIKALIYKRYLKNSETGDKIAKNNAYKQALWNDLECKTLTLKDAENLSYKESSLLRYFTKYNQCQDTDFVRKEVVNEVKTLNINLRGGTNFTSFSIENSEISMEKSDFGIKMGLRLGLELEYVFPFNKNKWSVLIEPTYHTFKSKGAEFSVRRALIAPSIDYKAVQIPVGLRYYMFFNDDARLFINTIMILNFPSNSSKILLKNLNATGVSSGNSLDFDSNPRTFAVGVGYRSKGKISFETRYEINRDLLKEYFFWKGNYNVVSFILGYRIL